MNHPWKCFNTVIPFHRALLSANAIFFDEKSKDRGNIDETQRKRKWIFHSLPGSLKNERNGGFLKKESIFLLGRIYFRREELKDLGRDLSHLSNVIASTRIGETETLNQT